MTDAELGEREVSRAVLQQERPEEGVRISPLDHVLNYIRLGVREGRLVPGQRLVEPELVRKLAVSRGTVREALVRLQGEGVVEFERYRGARIRILSRQKVLELSQIRGVVEGLAARLAAEKLDAEGEKKLRAVHLPYEQVVRDYHRYNEAFHALVMELSGNTSIPKIISATLLETFRLQFSLMLNTPRLMERSYRAHDSIINAIIARDPAKAQQHMVRHVDESCQGILDAPEHYFE